MDGGSFHQQTCLIITIPYDILNYIYNLTQGIITLLHEFKLYIPLILWLIIWLIFWLFMRLFMWLFHSVGYSGMEVQHCMRITNDRIKDLNYNYSPICDRKKGILVDGRKAWGRKSGGRSDGEEGWREVGREVEIEGEVHEGRLEERRVEVGIVGRRGGMWREMGVEG